MLKKGKRKESLRRPAAIGTGWTEPRRRRRRVGSGSWKWRCFTSYNTTTTNPSANANKLVRYAVVFGFLPTNTLDCLSIMQLPIFHAHTRRESQEGCLEKRAAGVRSPRRHGRRRRAGALRQREAHRAWGPRAAHHYRALQEADWPVAGCHQRNQLSLEGAMLLPCPRIANFTGLLLNGPTEI